MIGFRPDAGRRQSTTLLHGKLPTPETSFSQAKISRFNIFDVFFPRSTFHFVVRKTDKQSRKIMIT